MAEVLREFALSSREGEELLLGRVLCRGEEEALMIGQGLHVFDFLFAVEHLPALNAEHFAVRLCLYLLKLAYEGIPFL